MATTATVEDLQGYLKSAIDVTKLATEIIREAFDQEKVTETKCSAVDLVTKTDKAVEQLIIGTLRNTYPDHCFIGEESVDESGKSEFTDKPTWIIDPVDGTANFVHRFPFVAVSIALCIEKKVVVALVHNCILDHMYTAILGQGAFCNGKPIHVASPKDITQSLVINEIGSSRDVAVVRTKLQTVENLVNLPVHGFRFTGSAALNICLISQGSGDVFYEYGMHCWDIAAGSLICHEAGGVCIDTTGDELHLMKRRIIAASSMDLAQKIAKFMMHIDYDSD